MEVVPYTWKVFVASVFLLAGAWLGGSKAGAQPSQSPLVRVVDLNSGESQQVELADGSTARVRLVGVQEKRDAVNGALRAARVTVEINGERVELPSGNYHRPRPAAGVQVDCPAVAGLTKDSSQDSWGLRKDARLRLWPAGSPLIRPGTFTYPVRQRWFASDTQMANEPVFVNGGDRPRSRGDIYYHSGLDIGGTEDMTSVVAATDGVVVSAAGSTLAEAPQPPVRPRYDVVYIRDARGWYYRYSHLASLVVEPGQRVRAGEPIGVLGKEGGSGGWAHLHFEIKSRQPSGDWGTQEGYAFLWEAYQRQYDPPVVAVARPHHVVPVGATVMLNGRKSWAEQEMARHTWSLSDGSTASGPVHRTRYREPGTYSEVLKVTDAAGHVDYDFTVVQVVDTSLVDVSGGDASSSRGLPPTIQAAFHPTLDVEAGEEVTFKVRSFRIGASEGQERWNFGDGSPPVRVQSDGNARQHAEDGFAVTTHTYEEPGHYIVTVQRTDADGHTATARLHVPVGQAR